MATSAHTRFLASLTLAIPAVALVGCESEQDRLAALHAEAGAKGRASALGSLVAAWRAKEVTLDAAMTHAHDRCDPAAAGFGPSSPAFAGAVLDAIATLDAELPHAQFNEFFYYRIGGLASESAAAAVGLGDLPLARSLVLAGGTRWQTDMYWMRHPAHDALATFILSESGEGEAALARLRSRPDLPDEVEAARRAAQEKLRVERDAAAREER